MKAGLQAREYAKHHLQNAQWSPEQIGGRLELKGLDKISHETIYQRILEDKNVGCMLYAHLRCKKKRKKRYGSGKSSRGTIFHRVDIEQRPAIVDSRKRVATGKAILSLELRMAVQLLPQ